MPIAELSSSGPSVYAEANWTRALALVGVFALVIAVREAVLRLVHHWPHASDDTADEAGRSPPDSDGA